MGRIIPKRFGIRKIIKYKKVDKGNPLLTIISTKRRDWVNKIVLVRMVVKKKVAKNSCRNM
jgi:hypothetical protein